MFACMCFRCMCMYGYAVLLMHTPCTHHSQQYSDPSLRNAPVCSLIDSAVITIPYFNKSDMCFFNMAHDPAAQGGGELAQLVRAWGM